MAAVARSWAWADGPSGAGDQAARPYHPDYELRQNSELTDDFADVRPIRSFFKLLKEDSASALTPLCVKNGLTRAACTAARETSVAVEGLHVMGRGHQNTPVRIRSARLPLENVA